MCHANVASIDGNPVLMQLLLCFLIKILSAIGVLPMSTACGEHSSHDLTTHGFCYEIARLLLDCLPQQFKARCLMVC